MKLGFAFLPIIVFGVFENVGAQVSDGKTRAPCQIAQDWVRDHPHVINAKLGEFALFPLSYRRASYATMSNSERISMWREHMSIYSGPASRLGLREKQFIDSVSSVLPEIFAATDKESTVVRLFTDATRVLGKHTAVVVFGLLGMVDSKLVDLTRVTRGPVAPDLVQIAASVTGASQIGGPADVESSAVPESASQLYFVNSSVEGVALQPKPMNTCNCHNGSIGDFCDVGTGPHTSCRAGSCVPSSLYCGVLFLQSCNGACS